MIQLSKFAFSDENSYYYMEIYPIFSGIFEYDPVFLLFPLLLFSKVDRSVLGMDTKVNETSLMWAVLHGLFVEAGRPRKCRVVFVNPQPSHPVVRRNLPLFLLSIYAIDF